MAVWWEIRGRYEGEMEDSTTLEPVLTSWFLPFINSSKLLGSNPSSSAWKAHNEILAIRIRKFKDRAEWIWYAKVCGTEQGRLKAKLGCCRSRRSPGWWALTGWVGREGRLGCYPIFSVLTVTWRKSRSEDCQWRYIRFVKMSGVVVERRVSRGELSSSLGAVRGAGKF